MNMLKTLAVVVVVTACCLAQNTTTPAPLPQLVDALTANGQFTIFLDLLAQTNLLQQINQSIHFAVFAPTDTAFNRLPAGSVDALKADKAQLESILGYHVVLSTSYHVQGSQQDQTIKSSNNLPIRINTYSILHANTVEGVNITIRNIHVYHGYAHGIDGIMTPPLGNVVDIGANRSDFSIFESLVTKANLASFFTNDHSTTFFVPNNDAFAKLSNQTLDYLNTHVSALTEVLKYHMVKEYSLYSVGMKHTLTVDSADQHHDTLMILEDGSGNIFVNHAKIIEKDISSINGVIHVVDTVLVPIRVQVQIEDQGIIVG
ncbi:transforming growth factor-beta-induced protein ig-h3-like [Physella acuta]|uniref:transforming growth factor-beta-induced protein ig-h3-like n=1 Tax=Physella acuta TaxID=109671 RepID=UPI0027DE8911|nr:transforming growth factor-beta-induced protein ig-h3-like [Physella acuta]